MKLAILLFTTLFSTLSLAQEKKVILSCPNQEIKLERWPIFKGNEIIYRVDGEKKRVPSKGCTASIKKGEVAESDADLKTPHSDVVYVPGLLF